MTDAGWELFSPGKDFNAAAGETFSYTDGAYEYKVTFTSESDGIREDTATSQQQPIRLAQLGRIPEETALEETGKLIGSRGDGDGSSASAGPRSTNEPEAEPSESGAGLASPGCYRIARGGTSVTEEPSVDSKDVETLKADTIIQVTEVVVDQGRTRGRIASPPGWVSLVRHDTGQRWATKEADPGTYKIELDGTTVTETASVDSSDVAKLPVGTEVEVVEVVLQEARIRGKIVEPAGWISLVKTATGQRWAAKVETDPLQMPGAMVRRSITPGCVR